MAEALGLFGGYFALVIFIMDVIAEHAPSKIKDRGWNYVPLRIHHQALQKRVEAMEALNSQSSEPKSEGLNRADQSRLLDTSAGMITSVIIRMFNRWPARIETVGRRFKNRDII